MFKGIADWARGNQEAAQTAVAAGQGAAAVSATVGNKLNGKRRMAVLPRRSRCRWCRPFSPSASSMGAFTLGVARWPLWRRKYLAAQRDKYDDWSKPLVALADRFQVVLPDFGVVCQNEYMRKREELVGNNLRLTALFSKRSMAQLSNPHKPISKPANSMSQRQLKIRLQTAQLTNAASQMTAAAAQMQAAVGKPIPVTVTVQKRQYYGLYQSSGGGGS